MYLATEEPKYIRLEKRDRNMPLYIDLKQRKNSSIETGAPRTFASFFEQQINPVTPTLPETTGDTSINTIAAISQTPVTVRQAAQIPPIKPKRKQKQR